jgi:hypothetical protein
MGEYGSLCRPVELLSLDVSGCERRKCSLRASWNKLGITEALVVAIIAEGLGGIVQELIELFIRDTSFGLQGLPVTTGTPVQS